MSGGAGLKRTAVFVRAHMADGKTLDLLHRLSESALFDVHVLANETAGPLDFGPTPKVAHDPSVLERVGLPPEDEYLLRHLSDVVLEHARTEAPGYELYIVIEYDVHLTRPDAAFVDALVRALSSPAFGDVELAGTLLRRSNATWFWHAGAAELFAEPWGVFFPFVVMSERAVRTVFERRLEEAEFRRARGAGGRGREWVFCEAFVPSALHAAGGFRMADLREILPGCYRPSAFHGTPALLHPGLQRDLTLEMMHPVVSGRDFLTKALDDAERRGRLAEFVDDLRRGTWPLDELAPEFEVEALRRLGG